MGNARKSIDTPVGFSDSQLLNYAREGTAFKTRVRSWNERTLLVEFSEVIAVRDRMAGEFSDLVSGADSSAAFLTEAMQVLYDTIPVNHGYEVYSFLNNDGEPSLEVVAAGCAITVEQ